HQYFFPFAKTLQGWSGSRSSIHLLKLKVLPRNKRYCVPLQQLQFYRPFPDLNKYNGNYNQLLWQWIYPFRQSVQLLHLILEPQWYFFVPLLQIARIPTLYSQSLAAGVFVLMSPCNLPLAQRLLPFVGTP